MRYPGLLCFAQCSRRSAARSSVRRGVPVALLVAALAAFLLPLGALAGGWAVVTLDGVPQTPHAGQVLSLGFMVRQHGVTPIDAPYGQGAVMTPVLTARNTDTGESLAVDARKEGPLGHFVVNVAFPSAGTWSWAITPAPFAGTTLEPLTVAPPAPSSGSVSGATVLGTRLPAPPLLRVDGLGLLLLALLLAAISRRHLLGRRFVFRSR